MKTNGTKTGMGLLVLALGGVLMTEALYGCSSDAGVRQFVEENVGEVNEALVDAPPTPVTVLPRGLTCGIAYYQDGGLFGTTKAWMSDCAPALANAPEWQDWVFDGDFGQPSGDGFHHVAYSGGTTDPALSARFVLPKGAGCGFHHTLSSAGRTCMGFDPAFGQCPAGWIAKKHFDMSSGSGYFAWCEYQDPNNFCDATCLENAVGQGYACGISSNTDPSGFGGCGKNPATSDTRTACPANIDRAPFLDDGRPEGQGVAWCYRKSCCTN